MIEDPLAVLDQYLSHRRAREAEVLAAGRRRNSGATPEALVAVIYQAVKPELHAVARYSVWAHLRKLAAEGYVLSEDAESIDAPWWTQNAAPASVRLAGLRPGMNSPGVEQEPDAHDLSAL